MNVNIYNTRDYENKTNWTLGQNKPNSNPIKPNFKKAQMIVSSLITKGYRKKDDFTVRINKPNSNPIFLRTKTNATLFTAKDYENETAFRPQKNKPKTKPISSKAKIACQKIWPHPISITKGIINCIYEVGLIYSIKYSSAALRSRYEWEFPDFERS